MTPFEREKRMTNIVFDVPESVAKNFGPMRYDLEVPGLQCVIHMHRHPPGVPWSGDPCLMVTALPCPPLYEGSTDFYVLPTMEKDQWQQALAGWEHMVLVKKAMDELNRVPGKQDEWQPPFLEACRILDFDPEWRPSKQ